MVKEKTEIKKKITVAELDNKFNEKYGFICQDIGNIIKEQKSLNKTLIEHNKLINDIKVEFNSIKEKSINEDEIKNELFSLSNVKHDNALKIESFNVTLYSLIEKFKSLEKKVSELENAMNVIADKTLINIDRINNLENYIKEVPKEERLGTLKRLVKDINTVIENI